MRVHNTLTGLVEEFEPVAHGEVRMYVCGATVQAAPHLGHGRQAVVFDVMRRYFEWRGSKVTFVSNVTDVEDKIIATAIERGMTTDEVVNEAYEQFAEGYRLLGIRPPDIEPRATDHIAEIISMTERLIERGHAYESDGDVYFAVRSFEGYGKLSGVDLEDLLAGERIDPDERKRDPLDFALWKASKPGEPTWDSPWGAGRPGWHIECSAMAEKHLGFGFDIHGGGLDLVFPHHENEIAQSEAAAGATPFARYWLHNGMLNLAGEKMAKSVGNVFGLLDALHRWNPKAVRLFYLRKHYRAPLDFSPDALDDATAQLDRLWAFRRRAAGAGDEAHSPTMERFISSMDDDFNTAEALAALFDAVSEGNRSIDAGEDPGPFAAAYEVIVEVLGLAEDEATVADLGEQLEALATQLGVEPAATAGETVDAIVSFRQEARLSGDFEAADVARDGLVAMDIHIEDTPDGSRWHRK